MLRVYRTLLFTTIRHAQCYQARSFCASSLPVFDRKSKKLQRARASLRAKPSLYDYLRDEAAFRIADRICDITRVFDIAAEVGCGRGHLIQNLTSDSVKFLYQCDNCVEILKQNNSSSDVKTLRLNVDEEHLPFAENSINLILSSLSLHWVNNLPSTLSQVLRALKPDGCFLGVTFTTDTLFELRVSLQLAETERLGGFYPHISPFVESARFGELLQECGFSLISLDVDDVEVLYPSMFELIDDLRGMGESNAAISRPLRLNRDVLFAASSIYDDRFGTQRGDGEERCVPATFRFLFFIAWKPDPSQAKPLPRGSGEFSLRDIGRLDELSAELEKRHSRKPE
uniref:Arginine-hydroxylase NDUFAF5, mitochondrial n=1 Tax=Echinococcus canadensis TaxID=519352 RepID=A0A915EZM8_9CEST